MKRSNFWALNANVPTLFGTYSKWVPWIKYYSLTERIPSNFIAAYVFFYRPFFLALERLCLCLAPKVTNLRSSSSWDAFRSKMRLAGWYLVYYVDSCQICVWNRGAARWRKCWLLRRPFTSRLHKVIEVCILESECRTRFYTRVYSILFAQMLSSRPLVQ